MVWLSQNTLFLQLLPLALAKKSGSVPPLQVGFLRQSQGSSFHPGLEWVIAGLLFYPSTASLILQLRIFVSILSVSQS